MQIAWFSLRKAAQRNETIRVLLALGSLLPMNEFSVVMHQQGVQIFGEGLHVNHSNLLALPLQILPNYTKGSI